MPSMAEQTNPIPMPTCRQSKSPSILYESVPQGRCSHRRPTTLSCLNVAGRIINFHLRIKNPLAHVSPEQLRIDVENFAKEHQLTELTPLLMKGAFVAKDPPAFESVEGLTEDEKTAIRNEVLHKWRQPKSLFFTIILCSIGAAVQSVPQPLRLTPVY
jgi:hypothetical protein